MNNTNSHSGPIVIAFANCKGGVAKTASSAAIGGGLALRGFDVLLLDFDCQGNLSNHFLRRIPDAVAADIFNERKLPAVHVQDHLDIVPTDDQLNVVDHTLSSRDDKFILEKVLMKHAEKYDFVVIDCPPALNWITLNAFVAANFVFVPMKADRDSLDGLKQIASYCYQAGKGKTVAGAFFTMFEGNLRLAKKIESMTRQGFDDIVLETKIRKCSKVPEARDQQMILQEYDRTCTAAVDYESLIDEILERTQVSKPVE